MLNRRFLAVVFLALLMGFVALFIVHRNNEIRETPIARSVCATPDSEVRDVPWKFVVSNMTVFAFTSSDPGWLPTDVPAAEGEQCVVVLMRPGDVIKINGLFHSDPGFWLYMLDAVNAKRVTVDGKEVNVTNVSWGRGSDGQLIAP